MTLLQLMAVALDVLALVFFWVFAGYYFRNRRMALELRRRLAAETTGDKAAAVDPEGAAGPTVHDPEDAVRPTTGM